MDYTDRGKKDKDNKKSLRIVYGDVVLGVHGKGFDYLFSYAYGGPESLAVNGEEWLYRVPKPTFWRAVTDNDRANRFPFRSGMWLAADMFLSCICMSVSVNGKEIELPIAPANNTYTGEETAETIAVTFTYETITIPATTVAVTYEVRTNGQIKADVHYRGNFALPELPVFGMRFIMPSKAVSYRYEGLSGETYPDRMAGGIPEVYEIEGLPVTKYLVPQDCQVHMDTKWLEIYRNDKQDNVFGLRFTAVNQNFAFSCIPYTAEELENATHIEELPLARRTVVCILGAVRGVGGINTWGADVEPEYHIDAGKDIRYSFLIEPCSVGL